MPAAGRRRTWAASSRATGALKRTLIGRIGRHGALARSRSQLKSAVKAARTVKGKRCSIVVTIFGLLAAAMPLPQTSRRAAPFGNGRSQRASSVRSARALSMRRAFSTCARTSPPTILSASRSPMPSTSHQALAATVSATAGPFRRSRKCWSSSMSVPPPGCIETTAGPPVENANRVAPVSAGALAAVAAGLAAPAFGAGFQSARTVAVQLVPGPSGSRKS